MRRRRSEAAASVAQPEAPRLSRGKNILMANRSDVRSLKSEHDSRSLKFDSGSRALFQLLTSYSILPRGPIAQRLEPPAHNRLVPGSNPGGPTIRLGRFAVLAHGRPEQAAAPTNGVLSEHARRRVEGRGTSKGSVLPMLPEFAHGWRRHATTWTNGDARTARPRTGLAHPTPWRRVITCATTSGSAPAGLFFC